MIHIILKEGYSELTFEFKEMEQAQQFQSLALLHHEMSSDPDKEFHVEMKIKEEA